MRTRVRTRHVLLLATYFLSTVAVCVAELCRIVTLTLLSQSIPALALVPWPAGGAVRCRMPSAWSMMIDVRAYAQGDNPCASLATLAAHAPSRGHLRWNLTCHLPPATSASGSQLGLNARPTAPRRDCPHHAHARAMPCHAHSWPP